jgi:NAD(P)-dependent dehydrogenase (short-subunit alcohol dehydrogenase family)/uncharacterized OB-fold protein
MTEPLAPPKRKNPVERTVAPTLPPGMRSRKALGLTAAAAQGEFRLQVCQACAAVQYPPREVCRNCLSGQLAWQAVNPHGKLIALTTLHHSNDLYFRERLPWRVGTVQLEAGPSAVTHVHGDCKEGERVRLVLKLDRSGQAVLIALPPQASAHMEDDPVLRSTSCDPKFRRVLVTNGKTAVGMALTRALLKAGASAVYAGDPELWRKSAEFDQLCADERVQPHPLDVTDTDSVQRLAASIGGKVDILINTTDYQRGGGVLYNRDLVKAMDALQAHCLGLMRLGQHFGPGMAARSADGVNSAVAWVNLLSIYALMNLPQQGMWSAAQAAALSTSQCLRSELLASGVRVVQVFSGPIEQEWEQLTPPPRVTPASLASAVVAALQAGTEDVFVGDTAKEFMDRLRDNPKGLERMLGHS